MKDDLIEKIASIITEDPDVFSPENRAELHKKISRTYRSDNEKWVMSVVRKHLLGGSSSLKEPLKTGSINMDDVIEAVKAKRCIGAKDQDIGHTYIKNIVGNAIRDEFQGSAGPDGISINDARKVFGLSAINPETKSQRKKRS